MRGKGCLLKGGSFEVKEVFLEAFSRCDLSTADTGCKNVWMFN